MRCQHEWRLLSEGQCVWQGQDIPHRFFCIHCLEIKEISPRKEDRENSGGKSE